MRSCLIASFVLAASLQAAHKPQKIADGRNDNDVAAITATVYADPETVAQAVGSDLQGHYTVVKVELTPKSGPLTVSLDDFLLRTDKDGEKSHPFVASQIAGSGALVISQTATGGGRVRGGDPNGPVWGGIPGTGQMPRQLPGNGTGVGNTETLTGAAAKSETSDKKDPLEAVLSAKMLQEKQIDKAASGLLYFPLEKQKVKDLELIYTTAAGKLSVRFK